MGGARCELYGLPASDSALVTLHHAYMQEPASVVEYSTRGGGVTRLEPHELEQRKAELIGAVMVTHAVNAEVERLQDIGRSGWRDQVRSGRVS